MLLHYTPRKIPTTQFDDSLHGSTNGEYCSLIEDDSNVWNGVEASLDMLAGDVSDLGRGLRPVAQQALDRHLRTRTVLPAPFTINYGRFKGLSYETLHF